MEEYYGATRGILGVSTVAPVYLEIHGTEGPFLRKKKGSPAVAPKDRWGLFGGRKLCLELGNLHDANFGVS